MALPHKLIRDGGVIDDQFRLVRQLGQGGMGTVWAAEDLRLGRPVAIKFLSSEFLHDEQARVRFAREPRLASKIRSPHVVQVFAQGTTPDAVPYLVMELLEGEDLATRIAREGPCGLVETGMILEQIVRALSRAHREGLVHRDIKPHNVFLLPENDGQVFVKLLDFGIAKDIGARVTALTLTGEVIGSALYVSPEQLHHPQSVGPSTDIWSVGVMIYEMLTGKIPFEGNSLPELFMRVVECRYVPVSALGLGLPQAIDAFLQQVIVFDRARRFQSIDELGAAFARIVRANSSGLLLKPEARSADRTPAPVELPHGSGGKLDEPPTERIAKPWPMRSLVAVALAGALLVVAALLFARRGSSPPAAEPAALQPAPLPAAASPEVAPLVPSSDVPAVPPPSAASVETPPRKPAVPPKAPVWKKKTPDNPAAGTPVTSKPAQQNYGF